MTPLPKKMHHAHNYLRSFCGLSTIARTARPIVLLVLLHTALGIMEYQIRLENHQRQLAGLICSSSTLLDLREAATLAGILNRAAI